MINDSKSILINNTPNASKLLNLTLRQLGYKTNAAINELVDNSIDAGALRIDVVIVYDQKNIIQIDIIDNGEGMNQSTLIESMRLASLTEKNLRTEIGCYGSGGITAGLALGKSHQIFSRKIDSENPSSYKIIQDLDLIEDKNEFVVSCEKEKNELPFLYQISASKLPYKEWTEMFKKMPNILSGTIVTLKKLDKLDWKQSESFAKFLQKVLGQTYRKFCSNDLEINVLTTKESDFSKRNSENLKLFPVDSVNPIHDFEPELLNDSKIIVNEEELHLKIYRLKDYGREINKEKKLDIAGQGFYFLRNNREIATGETLNLFTKHNDFNLLRCELSFSAILDKEMGVNFQKSKVNPAQSIIDKIAKEFTPFAKKVKKDRVAEQRSKNKLKGDEFKNVEKFISGRSHLLLNPKGDIEKRNRRNIEHKKKDTEKKNDGSPRLNYKKKRTVSIENLAVRFETIPGSAKGRLWEQDMEGKTVVIKWNEEHPFYIQIVQPNVDNPEIFNPIAFLAYSFASSELRTAMESDSLKIADNIMWDAGRNLSVLMSD